MTAPLNVREAIEVLDREYGNQDPAAILYGPDNRPIMASTHRQGLERVEKNGAWRFTEDQVAKRVRSQGTTVSQVWDPSRGKPKPTSVTFETLRMMSNRNEWCSAIIKTRINQIGRSKWTIKPKDDKDTSSATEGMCDTVTKLLKRPSMHGSRPSSRSWRQFIGEILRDILALDAGCIEKERNGRGWIVGMYPVDGATIQPNIDEQGGYDTSDRGAYVQIVDGQVTARFGMEDLVYIMDNPQTDVRYAGYGFSPLEWLMVSVAAELYASKYNSSYFERGAVPEGLLNLGEEVSPEDVDAFRLYWMNEIMGKPWSIPIIGGKGVEWVPWRSNNNDMQYQEYCAWLMKKICAVYQIPPQEVGMIEDVNRSTADEQEGSNESKSLEPIKTLIQDYFEVEVIGEHGLGVGDWVEFAFDEEDDSEAQVDLAFQARVQAGMATRNEWRKAVQMEPSEEEGADMLLVVGEVAPLPTAQDVAVMGAAAQQAQEQDQFSQQLDHESDQASQQQSHEQGLNESKLQTQTKLAAMKPAPAPGKPPAKVAKTTDRNPALTEVHGSLEADLDEHADELLGTLERILGISIDDAATLTGKVPA